MNVGNHLPDRLIQQHRLTIGHLNSQISAEDVRHHGIRAKSPPGGGYGSLFAITAQYCNLATVDLPGKNKPAGSHEAGNNSPVFSNVFLAVTNAEADIQTGKWRLAVPGVAGEDAVIDPATGGQISKLIKRYAVLSGKYHPVSPARAIPVFFR